MGKIFLAGQGEWRNHRVWKATKDLANYFGLLNLPDEWNSQWGLPVYFKRRYLNQKAMNTILFTHSIPSTPQRSLHLT